MGIKRKTLSRKEWPRILQRRYAKALLTDGCFDGTVSLIAFQKVVEPFQVMDESGAPLTLVDVGYHWLQLAPRDCAVWLTVFYDANGSLIQLYFDITSGNVVLPDGDAYMDDLYLDLIMLPDGTKTILDEDELQQAYADGAITDAQRLFALDALKNLLTSLAGHEEALISFCQKQFERLKPFLEDV